MFNSLIRKAVYEDLDRICIIYRQLYLSFCSLQCIRKSHIEEKIFNKEIIVLENNTFASYSDIIVGCSEIELSDIFKINTFAVKKEFHNKGFGKVLLNYILEEWFKSGFNEIELGTFEEYGSLEFYRKNGFKIKTIYNDIYNDNRKHKVFLLGMTREEYAKM